jgi:hypothetical protein
MIQMFINNEEVVSNQNISILEELLNTSSTILNNCYPLSWETTKDYVSNFYFPQDYSSCEIYNDNNLIFAGIVKNSAEISLRPTEPKYCSLQILDYKTLLSEGQCLDIVIPEDTIQNQIESVINYISDYGFVIGNIQLTNPNEIAGAYSTLDKTPYDVFQYFAEITGAKWFTRMIDENTLAIDFYSPELMPYVPDIEYTQEYFEENNIIDMNFSFGTLDYRNKQVILSDQVFSSIDTTDTIIATSEQNQFTLSGIVGNLKQVFVNGVAQSIGTSKDKELGIYADFYYKIGENTIESSINQPNGAEIRAIFTSLIKGRQVVSNVDEIERITSQIGRNGTIARYETRNDVSSNKALIQIAQSYLKYKGKPEILLTIKTQNKDLFNVGQQVYFNMTQLPILAQDYMIKSKEINIIKSGDYQNVFYTYTLCSNYDSENAINFFDNQRRKRSGNIDENEFITRNIDIDNEVNIIFDNLSIQEVQITDDNKLNASLNAVFIE